MTGENSPKIEISKEDIRSSREIYIWLNNSVRKIQHRGKHSSPFVGILDRSSTLMRAKCWLAKECPQEAYEYFDIIVNAQTLGNMAVDTAREYLAGGQTYYLGGGITLGDEYGRRI